VSALASLQRAFHAYVLHGDATVARRIDRAAGADPSRRLQIYYDAYRLRLIEALRTDFPALAGLAGEEGFDRLARAYIDAHPSHHFNLRWFGAHLAEFLDATASFASAPGLAETARFEWALTLAFDAADVPPLDAGALAEVPPQAWPRLCADLHPSVQRLELVWNVPELWERVNSGEPARTIERLPARQTWLVWRRELNVYFRALEADEAAALESVFAGASLATLCDVLCDYTAPEEVPARAAMLLQRWLGEDLIAGLRVT
jgi:hypothetical protein